MQALSAPGERIEILRVCLLHRSRPEHLVQYTPAAGSWSLRIILLIDEIYFKVLKYSTSNGIWVIVDLFLFSALRVPPCNSMVVCVTLLPVAVADNHTLLQLQLFLLF